MESSSYDAPVSVDHVGYQGTEEKLKEKAERDISMLSAEIVNDPENPYLHFQLGQSYMLMRDEENALPWFRKAMKLRPTPGADYTPSFFSVITQVSCWIASRRKKPRMFFLTVIPSQTLKTSSVYPDASIYALDSPSRLSPSLYRL